MSIHAAVSLACVLVTLVLAGCQVGSSARAGSAAMPPPKERIAVEKVLDDLHDAASKADETRYFNLFSADAVFLGTDASERWTVDQFRAYAHPYFSEGKGWTYLPRPGKRFITFGTGSATGSAWFDEVLDNAKYGECRGSGVLVKDSSGAWKIAQYNLTVPVPNALLPKVVEMIRAEGAAAPTR